jgi:hypothetical protein
MLSQKSFRHRAVMVQPCVIERFSCRPRTVGEFGQRIRAEPCRCLPAQCASAHIFSPQKRPATIFTALFGLSALVPSAQTRAAAATASAVILFLR